MFKDSKIYVAGHSGLLGSALVRKLREKGYYNIVTQPHSDLELMNMGDVNDFFEREMPEIVFMSAGRAGNIRMCSKYPASFLYENSMIQNNVFAAAQRYEVKHLVYYGSSCTYPKDVIQPIKEEYFLTGPLEETSEAYAAAKLSGILACKAYNIQYNTNRFIALIPNTLYGPNDHFNIEHSHVFSALINRFYEAKEYGFEEVTLWGSGNPRREFIFSEDVAEASIFMVENADKLENTHYNVGTGVDFSIRELSLMIAREVGFKGEIIWDTSSPDGPYQKLLDSKMILQLGWKPSVAIEDGLRITYQWYLENVKNGGKHVA